MSKTIGFICFTPTYKYNGIMFEFSQAYGPVQLTKTGKPRKCAEKTFWNLFSEWQALTKKEQESYRVSGGCERLTI